MILVARYGAGRLIQFMRTFQIEMLDQAAGVRTRPEMVIQWHVRPPGDRDRLDVAADTAVDKHRLALDFASIVTQETMFRFAFVQIFQLRLHFFNPNDLLDGVVSFIAVVSA
jgi:hypothetical protein